jgi:hypothetical protein
MSFRYPSKLLLDQKILLTIPSQSHEFYCIQGEVRNGIIQPDGSFIIGTQFLDISFEVKKSIRSFVSKSKMSWSTVF